MAFLSSRQQCKDNGTPVRASTAAKVLALSCVLAGTMLGQSASAGTLPASMPTELVYIGTMDQQIDALHLDVRTGALTMLGPVEKGLRSTWLRRHPDLPILYSVDDHNDKDGSVTAFAVNRDTGALSKINAVATGGRGTTYLWFDAASSTLFGANYASGSVSSIAVDQDGGVSTAASLIAEKGSGPSKRQLSAHAHSVAVDPSGRFALVPDLGADRVFVYRFDRQAHALTPSTPGDSASDAANPAPFVAPPGSGPRHVVFGHTGHFVYLITEMSAQLMVLRWDARQGTLALEQTLPLSTPEFTGIKSGSEVVISRDGRFVYAGNRGESALNVYRVDPGTGHLSLVQRTPSGGVKPWEFAIDPSGKWLLVDNLQSATVNVFEIDRETGELVDTKQSVAIPAPVSIAFVP